jgi:hypothetical protein
MPSEESLIRLLSEALEKLEIAFGEAFELSREEPYKNYDIENVGMAIGLIRKFQKPIFNRRPDLMPPPPKDYVPDPPLTKQQIELVNKLNEIDIKRIDKTLLSNACKNWRKVARVVGTTMLELSEHMPGIPDVYYAQRIQYLVNKGKLESEGNLAYMRYSEVRLPSK